MILFSSESWSLFETEKIMILKRDPGAQNQS